MYDEARLKQRTLLARQGYGQYREELRQLRKLERLQRSIRVARARLGMRVGQGAA